MSICWLTIGDGRDEVHNRSLESAREHVPAGDFRVVIDDSDHELGFAGAITEGWRKVRETDANWVFHLELDFIFCAPIPVDRILAVLAREPHLAQVCLKRQPVNEEELRAGGIVERDPDAYTQRVDRGDIFTEHRACFSTNPSFYPAALCAQGWPQKQFSEGLFTHRLLEDPEVRFAFWGAKFDEPLVEHIGERKGHGY